jgi:hypothetical protein
VTGGPSGNEGFCYRYFVELMSVDRNEIFGFLIETRDRYYELPFDTRPSLF